MLTKQAVLQRTDDLFLGTCPLQHFGSFESLYIPLHGLYTGGSVFLLGALQEGPVDGRIKHYIMNLLLGTHPHHFLQVFLQSLLVSLYAPAPQLQLHSQIPIHL